MRKLPMIYYTLRIQIEDIKPTIHVLSYDFIFTQKVICFAWLRLSPTSVNQVGLKLLIGSQVLRSWLWIAMLRFFFFFFQFIT